MKAEKIVSTGAAHYSAGFSDLHDLIVGGRTKVPVLDGTLRTYINFDNAASTPMAVPVKEKVDEFLEWYAAVHRGNGFKSLVASAAYEHAREMVADFVGADLSEHHVIFVRNATEAINRCAGRLNLRQGDVVLTTLMEHHSNLLTWRKVSGHVEQVAVDEFGAPVIEDLMARLEAHKGHVKLVAISGGSNVTGVIPLTHQIAPIVHEAGALLLVDAAQLAPHRPIRMGRLGDPDSIDFLAVSAHKMYAPLGCGVLVGPKSAFEGGVPELVGGGTVLFVSEEDEMWKGPPDSEEAGSPNVVGAIAMAAATRFLSEELGWERVIAHEHALTSYALSRLNEIPGLVIYGPRDPALPEDRLGVISFNIEKVHNQLTASILSHEYGIGTRAGCFCAHPYVIRLSGMDSEAISQVREDIRHENRINMPGAVRMSFGFYNTEDEVDAAITALWDIQNGKWKGDYHLDPHSGEYSPTQTATDPKGWFEL